MAGLAFARMGCVLKQNQQKTRHEGRVLSFSVTPMRATAYPAV
jgi:hypothetical protein